MNASGIHGLAALHHELVGTAPDTEPNTAGLSAATGYSRRVDVARR